MGENIIDFAVFPRIVRPAPDPLGLYLRVARNDHKELLNLIAAGDASCFGVVFDPTWFERHGELRDKVLQQLSDNPGTASS